MDFRQFRLPAITVLTVLLLAIPSWSQAQSKLDKTLNKAAVYFTSFDLVTAEALYQEALSIDPNCYDAAYRLGFINAYQDDYREALRWFLKASEIDPAKNDTVYLQIGLTYKRLENCRKAREAFTEFMNRHKTRDAYYVRAEREIKGCDMLEASAAQDPAYRIKPTSFNSTAADQYPNYLDQRQEDKFIVFTSHRPLPSRKVKNDLVTGQPKDSDLYQVVMENDSTFTEPVRFEVPINTRGNDGAATFSADGLTMYYTICNSKKNKNGCSIFESRYDPVRKVWGKPVFVESLAGTKDMIINSRGKTKKVPTDDRQPFMTRDGRTMFFISDRDGGEGALDIWYSRRVGAGWSPPVNAGAEVNTAFNEITPALSQDGTKLFFASNGLGGFGGYDLYEAKGNIGEWSTPTNLQAPVNSPYNDFGMLLLNDTTLLFTTNRPGGAGSDDIYWARKIYVSPPKLEIAVKGVIRDKVTKQPVEFATAILYKYQDDGSILALDTFNTDQSARYEFPLETGLVYKVLGNAPEYLANEVEVSTKEVTESTELERNIDIELEPIVIDKEIRLNNIYYDFDEYYLREDAVLELSGLLKTLRQNSNIIIELDSHTDSNGTEDYNQVLSDNRAKAAIRYLVENGIDPRRLNWKGWGEGKLLIYPEVSDEDEQLNRRTEFKIISIDFGI